VLSLIAHHRRRTLLTLAALMAASLTTLRSEQPPPQLDAVWNAASYLPEASAGALATAKGTNLASQTCMSNTVPLPRTLCGVRVTADGEDLPLLYVSSGQINFQLSYRTGAYHVSVTRDTWSSNELTVQVLPRAPGIFMYDTIRPTSNSVQCRNVAAAELGDFSVMGPGNALHIPETSAVGLQNVLVLYVQGLGTPLDDNAAPLGDIYRSALIFGAPEIYLDGVRQSPTQNLYVGSAPGTAIQQINWVPDVATAAGAHTLHLCAAEVCSRGVTVFMTKTGKYVAGNMLVIDDGDPAAVRARAGGQDMLIDKNGNFLADTQGEVKLEFLGMPAMYNWRKDVAVNATTVLDDPVQMFRTMTDTANRYDFHREIVPDWKTQFPEMVTWTAGDNGIDLLDHIYWAYGTFWCNSGILTRLPGSVLPKKVFVPPVAGVPIYWRDAIAGAVARINSAVNRIVYTVLDRSAGQDEAGYTFRLSPTGAALFSPHGSGGCGDSFDIPSASVQLDPDNAAMGKDQLTGTAEHELHHGLGLFTHARPPAYLMYFVQAGNDALTALETRADEIVFGLNPGTNLRLYDRRPD
jgi:uncharacterized protein (TIGR03437 family)